MRSALYACTVMHQRLSPRRYGFAHRMFTLALDVDELDALARRIPWFGHNAWNVVGFDDRDHITLPGLERAGVRANLTAWLAREGVTLPPDARVTLVTMPRVLGYVFNPVSFYFCQAADGAPIVAVAEVNNTFGEMKLYRVDHSHRGAYARRVRKDFYVSPFSPLDLDFDFRLEQPGERLSLRVNDWAGDDFLVATSLMGERRPLTAATLGLALLRHPLQTLRVITLIHWHAVRLWLARVPWHRKAERPDAQRDLFRPHASPRPSVDSLIR